MREDQEKSEQGLCLDLFLEIGLPRQIPVRGKCVPPYVGGRQEVSGGTGREQQRGRKARPRGFPF